METWKTFEANELTHSASHHLQAIHEVGAQYGGWARVSDIARRLGITRGSVSINLRALKKRGLVVTDEHRMVKLTPQALEIVRIVAQRKETLQAFMMQVLHLPAEQADIDSCKIEHLVSDATEARMKQLVDLMTADSPAARELLQKMREHEPDTKT